MFVWASNQLRPIAQPKAIGDVAVGVVSAESRKVFLVGIDPGTGRELWRQPTTPSMVSTGTLFHFEKVGDDRVAYLRPTRAAEACHAELVVADARTGRDIVKSPEAVFTSWPTLCRNGRDLCTTSRPAIPGSSSSYRLDIATGRYLEGTDGIPGSATTLVKDLLRLGELPEPTLAFLRDGKLAWRIRESSAFPPDLATAGSYGWYLFADQHVLVGSVSGKGTPAGSKFLWDLPTISASAGLSETTGEVLWRDPGSFFKCRLGYMEYPVRCRSRGTAMFEGGVVTSFDGLDVTIEGFDVMTGKTTWSVPLGAATMLYDAPAQTPIASESRVVLPSPRGPIVLDLATGGVEPARPGATFWCMKGTLYESEPPIRSRKGSIFFIRPGGRHAAICDARGQPATELPSWAATAAAGARFGNRAVLATKNGFLGFATR
jgi:hypothetical protein